MVQIDLEDGEALVHVGRFQMAGRETAFTAPQRPHPLQVVRFHGGHELREGLLRRLRCELPRAGSPTREAAQRDEHGQSWSHGRYLEWGRSEIGRASCRERV